MVCAVVYTQYIRGVYIVIYTVCIDIRESDVA